VTITATVTPNPGGGQVVMNGAFYDLDPVTGSAAFQKKFGVAGLLAVDVTYVGDTQFLPSMGTGYVQVNDHPVGLTLHVPDSVGRGDPFNVTVDITGSPPAGYGYVSVRDMTLGGLGFPLGSTAITGTSPLTVSIGGMMPGEYELQASWPGGPYYTSATSGLEPLTVFDRPTTTTLTASPDPSKWGEPVNVHVVVDPYQAEGSLVIKVDGSVVATPTLNPNGVANVSIVPGPPGAHTITAEFGDQANPTPPEPWAPSSDSEPHTVSSTPIDTTPPSGTVSINNGADIATDLPVGLTLTGADSSGIQWTEISNDGVSWYAYNANLTEWGWNLCDPDYGGVVGDGLKTVYVRWKDWYGNVSSVATDSIWLDFFGPTGTVTIFDGSGYVISSSVPVSVPATDDGSDVTAVSLSNDAVTWTTKAYEPTIDWNLTPGDGKKTVHVKWEDAHGNWSDESTDTIVVDTIAPSVGAPKHAYSSGATVSSGAMPTKFTWTGTDATSGIGHYQAALSTDGGAYSTISTTLTSAQLTRNLAAGHSYRLRTRAIDKAGNVGAWAYGSTFTVKAYQETSSSIVRSGSWSISSSASYWGGAERFANDAGASAKLTFTGRSFAWVGSVGPSRGSARVYVNGVLVKTISLYSASTAHRRVLLSLSWSTAVSRTVKIVVVGTVGHPRVDVDALVTGT
jgi:hypothetical protein